MVKGWARGKSPWVYHMNTGGCNGCDIEELAALASRYDPERIGVKLVSSPKHADIILLTGPVNRKNEDEVERVLEQVPEPKKIMVIGSCAISSGPFQGSYNIAGPIDELTDVDLYIPGCPVKPEAILEGLKKLAGELADETD